MSVEGRIVVIAGATSSSGIATARALGAAGATVVAVGSNQERLDAVAEAAPSIRTRVCDLGDLDAVISLAAGIRSELGGADGLVHLVGGWRGGAGLTGQNDEDWRALEAGFTTLRNTSRAFYDDLVESEAGRLAVVSSTAVDSPTAGAASYAAAKAAAEAWVSATADGFRRAQSGSTSDPEPQRAAAVRFVIRAFVDESMRTAAPEKPFEGHTDVAALADAVVGLWAQDAGELNGARIRL
jgi:3-oxoacyl-[acyl-carrier protein] reductase